MNWPVVVNVIVLAFSSGALATLTAWQMDATHQWTPALVTGGIAALTYLTGRMQQSPRPPRRKDYPWKKLGVVLLVALPLLAGCGLATKAVGPIDIACAGRGTISGPMIGTIVADCGDGFRYRSGEPGK